MNRNAFLAVAGVAVLAAIMAIMVARQRAPETDVVGDEALFPGLDERLNDVDRVVITGAGGEVEVTLARGDSAWSVAERDGYPAQTSKIRKLLIDLADARLVERKTSREDNYPALGVEDVDGERASGVEIALGGLGDELRVIVGKRSRGGDAVYVRHSDEDTAWVADQRLRVEESPTDWLVPGLIDIDAARVSRVTITHPDGEVLDAVRGEANFEVVDLPDGAALSSPTAANELSRVFDDLKFDDVVATSRFDPGDAEPVTVRLETSDGLIVEATVTAANDLHYLALTTSAQPIAVESAEPTDAGEVSPEVKASTLLEGITNQSQEINARVNGWVFTIPLYKYEQLARRRADLTGE